MTPCDASPLIALINKGDKNHQTCVVQNLFTPISVE